MSPVCLPNLSLQELPPIQMLETLCSLGRSPNSTHDVSGHHRDADESELKSWAGTGGCGLSAECSVSQSSLQPGPCRGPGEHTEVRPHCSHDQPSCLGQGSLRELETCRVPSAPRIAADPTPLNPWPPIRFQEAPQQTPDIRGSKL